MKLRRRGGIRRILGGKCLSLALVGLIAGGTAAPRAALAWDPSSTLQSIAEAALLRSAWHVRWMEASELRLGAFTDLQLDPTLLDHSTRAWVSAAIRISHGDIGAHPLGGPGACPGPRAPIELQRYCVDENRWSLDAFGWLRLGMIAEGSPRSRLYHHFSQLGDASAERWQDSSDASKARLRGSFARRAGEPGAAAITGTSFDGASQSAAAFLASDDPLGPQALALHLEAASLAETAAAREHHRALALICAGAIIRVVVDQSVPAYARGDVASFLMPLSRLQGDRGDALVEYVRSRGPAKLDGTQKAPSPGAPRDGRPLAAGFVGHIHHGEGPTDSAAPAAASTPGGLASFTASHFLSPGTLPAPMALAKGLDAEQAAQALLGEGSGLAAEELEGMHLSPWPAAEGYLLNAAGRPLAAFETDNYGDTYLFLDDAVLRDQAAHLIPRAVDHATSILDLVFAGIETPTAMASGRILSLAVAEEMRNPELLLLVEDAEERRSGTGRTPLRPGEVNRIVGLPAAPKGGRVILVMQWDTSDGVRLTSEFVVPVDGSATNAETEPASAVVSPPSAESAEPEAPEAPEASEAESD